MADFVQSLEVGRSIVGTCPVCSAFFRLSEVRLIVKRSRTDWLDGLCDANRKLEAAEDRLDQRERELRRIAREKGRAQAQRLIRKVDPLFAPRGLKADDAKPLFHPIDWLVFDQLGDTDSVKAIHFLDRRRTRDRSLQRSVERCISKRRYDWSTFRVSNEGKVIVE